MPVRQQLTCGAALVGRSKLGSQFPFDIPWARLARSLHLSLVLHP